MLHNDYYLLLDPCFVVGVNSHSSVLFVLQRIDFKSKFDVVIVSAQKLNQILVASGLREDLLRRNSLRNT